MTETRLAPNTLTLEFLLLTYSPPPPQPYLNPSLIYKRAATYYVFSLIFLFKEKQNQIHIVTLIRTFHRLSFPQPNSFILYIAPQFQLPYQSNCSHVI